MRPLPWIVRVGLFAVGFGVGLSHYKAPSTQRPIVIEIRVVNPDLHPAIKQPSDSVYPPPPAETDARTLSART